MKHKAPVMLVTVGMALALSYFVPVAGEGPYSVPTSQRSLGTTAYETPFPFLFVGRASCSLASGACTTTIANAGTNSSYDLAVDSCTLFIIYYSDTQITRYTSLPGTVTGFVDGRLPAGSVVTPTCTVPTAQLAYQPSSEGGEGWFTMELVNRLSTFPPGKNATVPFGATWIGPHAPVTTTSTVTSMSTLTVTAISTQVSTTITTATETVTAGGGAVPVPPYELVSASVAAILLAATYLVVRRRAPV